MASVKTAISLTDQISAPLKGIINSMNMMLSAWQDLDSSTGEGLDIGDVEAIRAQLDQAADAIDEMTDQQEDYNDTVAKSENAVDGLTQKLIGMVAAIGLGAMAKEAIDFASDLAESQNVVDVSFGKNAEKIDAWAETTLNAFGLNELSAKKFAGTMGAMLKSSGLAGDEVADMSMKIVEMAGDMASFYNLEGEEAFNKLRSGISGETEPLKSLGINMSVANLEAYALSQGIETAYNEMSQAEQVQLRYNYLLQATADSQGDFSRTIDGFSNQQKLLQENWKALTGEIASNFLPILASLFADLNAIISFINENMDWIAPLFIGLLGIISTMLIFTHTAQIAAFATKVWEGAQAALNAVMSMNPIAWVIIAIIALIAVIIAVANHIVKTGEIATTAFGVITGGINVVIQAVKNVGLVIANVALGIWNSISPLITNIGVAFQNVISGVQGLWYGLLSTVLNVVAGICEALNKIPFISFDYSGITNAANEYVAKQAAATGNKAEYVDMSGAFSEGFNTFDAFSDGWAKEAYAAGAEWGDAKWNQWFGKEDEGSSGMDLMEDVAANTGSTAESAGSAAKALDATKEDLKYLRDIAEQDTINRFTTAQVAVSFGDINNTVSSNVDLDGIVDYLATGVSEALEITAEGVHA